MRRFVLPGWVNLLRTVLRFPARANTLSCSRSSSICAATVIPANGICERQIQEHKREGWQDRLSPVLGTIRPISLSLQSILSIEDLPADTAALKVDVSL